MNCDSVRPGLSRENASRRATVRKSSKTDAMFTTIEGEWDECLDVVRRACEAVGRHGDRVSLVLKADIRPGYSGELTAKLDRLEAAMGEAGEAV